MEGGGVLGEEEEWVGSGAVIESNESGIDMVCKKKVAHSYHMGCF